MNNQENQVVRELETISANHLEIIGNAVRVFRSKDEQVTEFRVVEFTRLHFPEYRSYSYEFLASVAQYVLG